MRSLLQVLAATAVLLGAGNCVAEDAAHEPGVVQKVENAVVRAAHATERGIRKGATAAAEGIETGVKAAGRGIECGAKAVGRVAQRVGEKIQGAVGSEPSQNGDG